MQLSLQSFSNLVQNMAAAVQSTATQLLDLTVGSTLRAILEGNASVALWMQWLILQVLQMTRAATSTGPDLDSWMADMSLTRLPAVAASGLVTFSRYTSTNSALVPAGALVRTNDGAQTFAVTVDAANPAWTDISGGYLIASGTYALTVPVTGQIPGSAGNVQNGAITQLVTAIPGVDLVTNTAALQGGMDAETDTALRARFQNFIQSRSRATPLAIGYAVSSIQQGLNYAIQENVDSAGNARLGSFVVTIDDGTGQPPTTLIDTVAIAVEAARPIGSMFAVQPPAVTTAQINLLTMVSAGTPKPLVVAAVGQSISSYVNELGIGVGLPLTKVAQLAYAASPSVINVSSIFINGLAEDLLVPVNGVVKSGTIAVT